MTERLQKFLAGAGVASRRKAEALIAEGRVRVNGAVVTQPGTVVDPASDHVEVDGRAVSVRHGHRYLLLYKPPGCVTTLSDPQGRPTAAQYLQGIPERVFPVGRLDWDAEGALLFTTDGELANRLAHPRYGHRRTYLVKVKGDPPPEALERMRAGVRLEDGPAQALETSIHERADKNTWIRVVVGEGRRHLVKRLCESVSLEVLRLFRPEFGGVSVAGLRPGRYRELGREEVAALRAATGMKGGGAAPVPAEALPRAARRHGHGAPAPPPPRAERPARAGRDDRQPRRDDRRPQRDDRQPRRDDRRPQRDHHRARRDDRRTERGGPPGTPSKGFRGRGRAR